MRSTNVVQKWGIAVSVIGAIMVVVPAFQVFTAEAEMSKRTIDFMLSTFMVGFVFVFLGVMFVQIGDQKNWEVVATHRDYAFLRHRISGKRSWTRVQTRLTKAERAWIDGEVEEIRE